MMSYRSYGSFGGLAAFQQPRTQAVYTHTVSPKCQKAFMSEDAFRVLLRSVAGGCWGGQLINEDGVQLYGWRIREKDGSLSAIITDVVESSPKSHRTAVSFDVDHEYAIHRDRYLRDRRWQANYNLLGYIHSHPDHMTHFSQTDVDTMAEYTRSDMEVMLSGLVTLYRGDLELTMYAATQTGDRMQIWELPLQISDEEVNRRLPVCAAKPYEQIWREASGTEKVPRLRMLDAKAVFPQPGIGESGTAGKAAGEKRSLPVCAIATDGICEGAEGVLCGRMQNGTLHLYLQPAPLQAEPAPPPVPEGDTRGGEDPDAPEPAGEG